jgi:hypothetical protein
MDFQHEDLELLIHLLHDSVVLWIQQLDSVELWIHLQQESVGSVS